VRHLKVSTKLIGVIGIVLMAAAAAVGWVVFGDAERALQKQAVAQLEGQRSSRARSVSVYAGRIQEGVLMASRLISARAALREMPAAIEALPRQLGRSAAPGTADFRDLEAFYQNDIRARLQAGGVPWQGADRYLSMPAPLLSLQSAFIARNPNPIDQKYLQVGLDAANDYDQLHGRIHPLARGFIESFSFDDVLLVGLDGTVLYSCLKQIDFATNLRTGPFRESGLARAFAGALDAPLGAINFVDFAPYEPAFGAPAAFVSTPVFEADGTTRRGVLVYQLLADEINALMNDAAGFGESGEAYVIGNDLRMRSNSRFSTQPTALQQAVETDAARRALAGESGTIEHRDYRGVQVLSSFAPVDILGVRWGILAESDLNEALAPVRQFRTKLSALLILVVLIAGAVLWTALQRIVLSPVAALAAGASRVASRDYSQPVNVQGLDELGLLGRSFNGMMLAVGTQVDELRRAKEKVSQIERERELALSAAGVGVWRGDIASNTWTMDARARTILGLPEGDALDADAWIRALHPEDRDRAVARFGEVMKTPGNYQLEYRVVWPNGQVRHILDRGMSSGPEGGTPTRVDGIFYDITELRMAEQRGQRLLEAAPDAMVVADATGTIALINAAAERLFGYSREELVGQPIETLVPDAVGRGHVAKRNAYLGAPTVRGMGSGLDLWGRRKGGSLVPVEISLSPMEAPDGRLVVAAVRDITDRRTAELSLKDSEERLGAAARGANLGLWDVDPTTSAVLVNSVFESQLGYAPLELRESDEKWTPLRGGLAKWFELVHPDDRDRVGATVEQFFAGGSDIYKAEQRVRRPDGSYTWVLSVGNSVTRDPEGRPLRANGVHIDISDIKSMQVALESAKDAAEHATRAKSDFLANMSHEIRTPMNAIMGMTHLALQTTLTPQQEDYLTKAHHAAEALLGIINDILDFSKIEAGMLTIEHIDFSLDETLDGVANLIAGKAQQKRIELLFDRGPDVPTVLRGDPLRLGQILVNLGNNAVKFTESGEIVISVHIESQNDNGVVLRFSVRDTGIGMSPEQMSRLFQAFSQADTSTTRRYGGTGLGLSICRSLAELMGGRIQVDSRPGIGSTFSFTAPFGIGQMRARLEPHPAIRGRRVLIIDDNETSRQILHDMMHGLGCVVALAASGDEGLEQLATQPPADFVLLDWKMPGKDGFQTLQAIREQPERYGSPKVVMVTAYGREEVMKRAYAAQLNGFLIKPVTQSTLFDALIAAAGAETNRRTTGRINRTQLEGLDEVRGARILLAEDNEINQQVAREILQQAGFVVVVVGNGRDAVTAVMESAYDAVLMDIQMPILDGLAAAREIRAEEAASARTPVPIIAMTAHAMAGDSEKSVGAGMNDHVTKPINPDQLFTALARVIVPRSGIGQDAAHAAAAPAASQAATDLPATLPGIDLEDGLGRLGGNARLYRDILARLAGDFGQAVSQMRQLLTAADVAGAGRIAHSLKGVAANVGARDLSAASAAVETACMRGSETERDAAIRALEQPLQIVMEGLTPLTATRTVVTADAGAMSNVPEALRNQLRQAAAAADIDVLTALLDEVSTHDPALAQTLRALVDNFEYEALQRRLDE
jgi:PAS domain S-box-containing protein